jgi:tRNA U34 5-carboxymethylaminomethyl modifying GTPase MnmE/TrmE
MGAVADALVGALSPVDAPALHAQARQRSSQSLNQVRQELSTLRSEIVAEGDETLAELPEWLEILVDHVGTARRDLPTEDAPARVVLMGRTQAGKSTIFRHLTGSNKSEIGSGGQCTTREVIRAPYRLNPGVVIADAPGVGALEGIEDQRAALDEARRADLVVWVFTTDSLPEDTRHNLALVASWGVPMIRVLQCQDDLVHVPGIEPGDDLAERGFLKAPEKHPVSVIKSHSGHMARADRTLNEARQDPGPWIPVHAQAAVMAAQRSPERAQALLEASNIAALEAAIESELVRNRDARRLVATSDIARRAVREVEVHLAGRAEGVREQMEAETGKVADLRQRILDELDRARGKHKRTLRSRLGRLDRWADDHYRDSSKDLEKNWASTSEQLHKKIDEVVEQDWDSLRVRLAEIQAEVNAAWRKVALQGKNAKSPRSKVSVNPVWFDPAVRVSASLVGGAIGFTLGGPLGALVGGVIGDLVGPWLSDLFGSRRSQLNRRRGELHKQVMDAKDATLEASLKQWDKQVARIVKVLERNSRQAEKRIARCLEIATTLEEIAVNARRAVDRCDADLVHDLLVLRGCADVASAVGEVRRVPGGTTLVGLRTSVAFEESVARRPHGVGDLRFYPCDEASTPQRRIAQTLRLGQVDGDRSIRSGIEPSGPPYKIFLDVPKAALVNEQWAATSVSGEECTVVLASDRKG